jgi:hypothetical protein
MTVVTAWMGGVKLFDVSEGTSQLLPKPFKDILFDGIAINCSAFEASNQEGKKVSYVSLCPLIGPK